MKRYLCCVAVLGVLAVPDWASAFFHRPWCPPAYPAGGFDYAPPVPVYPIYPQPLVVVQPCVPVVPVYGAPLAPPQVYPVPAATTPRATTPAPQPDTAKTATPPKPAPPPAADPVRPATGSDQIPPPGKPVDPPLNLPPLPRGAEPKSKAPGGGNAVPSAAPSPPDALPVPLPDPMPPKGKASATPEPKKGATSDDTLPPLILPPEGAGGPSGIVPTPATSTSKSSPLSAGVSVQVFTASGAVRSAATRKIGFFNHTDRDIDLTIEGRAVKLPRKSYIHAEVPPTFTWTHGDRPAKSATVPDGAAGLDVLFRE